MPAISPATVKELRERTGLGILECKKALKESVFVFGNLLTHVNQNSATSQPELLEAILHLRRQKAVEQLWHKLTLLTGLKDFFTNEAKGNNSKN